MSEQLVENIPTEIPPLAENRSDIDTRLTNIHQFAEQSGLIGMNPQQRTELIKYADTSSFIAAITAVHQIVAPEIDPSPVAKSISLINREGVITQTLAEPEQRLPIFENAIELSHKLIAKFEEEGGSTENLLIRLSNLAAFSIVLAHPFHDGNGRTARTVGAFIREGYDSETIENVSQNRPATGFRVNSYVPTGHLETGSQIEFLNQIAALDTPFNNVAYENLQANKITTPFLPPI